MEATASDSTFKPKNKFSIVRNRAPVEIGEPPTVLDIFLEELRKDPGIPTASVRDIFEWLRARGYRPTKDEQRIILMFLGHINSRMAGALTSLEGRNEVFADSRRRLKEEYEARLRQLEAKIREEEREKYRFAFLYEKLLRANRFATDSLTGLMDLKSFKEQAAFILSQAKEGWYSIGLIDTTGLKRINDDFGHSVGDTLISGAAQVLMRALRKNDFSCRAGGDEFAFMVRGRGDSIAGRIKNAIESVDWSKRDKRLKNFKLDADIGLVSIRIDRHCPRHSLGLSVPQEERYKHILKSLLDNIMDAIKVADKLMYLAKDQRKAGLLPLIEVRDVKLCSGHLQSSQICQCSSLEL